jgi:hypothetical protein
MPRGSCEIGPEHDGFLTPAGAAEPLVVWVGDRSSLPWSTYPAPSAADSLAYWLVGAWPTQTLVLEVRKGPPPPYRADMLAFPNGTFAPSQAQVLPLRPAPQPQDRWYRVTPAYPGWTNPAVIHLHAHPGPDAARLTWYRRGEGPALFWGDYAGDGRTLTFEPLPFPDHLDPGLWSITVEDQVVV